MTNLAGFVFVLFLSSVIRAAGKGSLSSADSLCPLFSLKRLKHGRRTGASSSRYQLLLELPGHTDLVRSVKFHPSGSIIASGSIDNTIKIWDATSGQALGTLIGHTKGINAIDFSPSGDRLASASDDGTVKIWDVNSSSYRLLHTLSDHTSFVFDVAYGNDEKLVSCSRDDTIKVWDGQSGSLNTSFASGHIYNANCVAFSPDGKYIASGSDDYAIVIYNAASGSILGSYTGHEDSVISIAYSPDGTRLASGSFDNTIKIWDTTANPSSSGLLHILNGHSKAIASVVYSKDGKHIVSSSLDNTIKIWDATSGDLFDTINEEGQIGFADLSPDDRTVASGSFDDNMVRVWQFSVMADGESQCNDTLHNYLPPSNDCCVQESERRKCGNPSYCFGVMISHQESSFSDCCNLYPSCGDTNTLFDTLDTLLVLSWTDVGISILVIVLLCIREIASSELTLKRLLYLIIFFEVVNLAIGAAIVYVANKSKAIDIANDLLNAQCFTAPGDESKINNIIGELEGFYIIAVIELVGEAVAVMIHSYELRTDGKEANILVKFGGIMVDVLEVIGSLVSVLVFLIPAINGFDDLYDSMKEIPIIEGHEIPDFSAPCLYTCCTM